MRVFMTKYLAINKDNDFKGLGHELAFIDIWPGEGFQYVGVGVWRGERWGSMGIYIIYLVYNITTWNHWGLFMAKGLG